MNQEYENLLKKYKQLERRHNYLIKLGNRNDYKSLKNNRIIP